MRRVEVKSVPSVSTSYDKSTCSEVKCTQPQCNAMLKICFFTAFCTNQAVEPEGKIPNTIIYNMSGGRVELDILCTVLAITYIGKKMDYPQNTKLWPLIV